MSREVRSYKLAYEPKDPTYPRRIDLKERQKNWIRRVWTWASTAMLGMKEECLPDAIPRYNEKRGWHYVPAVNPNLHHLTPVGESVRLDGDDDYNNPRNIAPVSVRLHVGKGVKPDDEDADEVIHQDTAESLRGYGKWKREGGKNPMQTMHNDRKRKTDRGEIYHNPTHDRQLVEKTQEVVDGYTRSHPDDKWPE